MNALTADLHKGVGEILEPLPVEILNLSQEEMWTRIRAEIEQHERIDGPGYADTLQPAQRYVYRAFKRHLFTEEPFTDLGPYPPGLARLVCQSHRG